MNDTLLDSLASQIEIAVPDSESSGIARSVTLPDFHATLELTIRQKVFREAIKRMNDRLDILLAFDSINPGLVNRFVDQLSSKAPAGDRQNAIAFPAQFNSTPYQKLTLIESAARELGRRWSEECDDFVTTSVGSARLQCLLHSIEETLPKPELDGNTPCILITSPASEQHTLMQNILQLLFRSRGWDAVYRPHISAKAIRQLLNSRKIDLICMSWSNGKLFNELTAVMSEVNVLGEKEKPPVMVGGGAAERFVKELSVLGVDCICDNVYSALSIAERYISLRRSTHNKKQATSLAEMTAACP